MLLRQGIAQRRKAGRIGCLQICAGGQQCFDGGNIPVGGGQTEQVSRRQAIPDCWEIKLRSTSVRPAMNGRDGIPSSALLSRNSTMFVRMGLCRQRNGVCPVSWLL